MSEITKCLLELPKEDVLDLESDDIPAVLKKSCFYIVSAVLLEGDKVLLISEAKRSCYGKWYLPAGRVESNETFQDAFKRELLEESFLEGEPDHLFSIEWTPFNGWFRFNFLGHATGGRLKTLDDADKESLEANWFSISDVLNKKIDLRYSDIIEVIRNAVKWKEGNSVLSKECSLPIHRSHVHMCQRMFLVDTSSTETFKVAVCRESGSFPVMPLAFLCGDKCLEYFSKRNVTVRVLGLISIEHLPKNETDTGYSDGLCFNILCSFSGESNTVASSFDWIEVKEELANKIKNMIESSSFITVNNDK